MPLRAEEREAAHVRDVTCVAFGKRRSDVVVTGSTDGTLRLWDLSDYGTRQVCVGPVGATCVAIDDELDSAIFGGFEDGYLRCYEAGSGVHAHHRRCDEFCVYSRCARFCRCCVP